MKRNRLFARLAPVLFGAVLSGGIVLAQQPAPPDATTPPPPPHQRHAPNPHQQAVHLSKVLNLTPDQTAKLEPILADRDQKMEAIHSNGQLTQQEVRQQMMEVRRSTQQQLETVLTPDQMQQMRSMEQEHRGRGPQGSPDQPAPPPTPPTPPSV
jgi:Spy/CpxP family protein refolding chaperone